MPVSFILRLVPRALAESRIVGRVMAVEGGNEAVIHNADDLIAFLFASLREPTRSERDDADGDGTCGQPKPGVRPTASKE